MAPNFAERVKPVHPERFHFALGVYCAAAAMKGSYENPEQYGLHMLDDAGKTTGLRFADIPPNRGMLAVKGICRPGRIPALGLSHLDVFTGDQAA